MCPRKTLKFCSECQPPLPLLDILLLTQDKCDATIQLLYVEQCLAAGHNIADICKDRQACFTLIKTVLETSSAPHELVQCECRQMPV